MFQSTHPRGVRPGRGRPYLYHMGVVSIHAPARGATSCFRLLYDLVYRVSIHAPARGATARSQLHLNPPAGFNPRTREGCDTRIGSLHF